MKCLFGCSFVVFFIYSLPRFFLSVFPACLTKENLPIDCETGIYELLVLLHLAYVGTVLT